MSIVQGAVELPIVMERVPEKGVPLRAVLVMSKDP